LKPHFEATRKDSGLFWPPQPVCQISESYFSRKYHKCKYPSNVWFGHPWSITIINFSLL
jgi:hypothetical protein